MAYIMSNSQGTDQLMTVKMLILERLTLGCCDINHSDCSLITPDSEVSEEDINKRTLA